MSQALYRPFEDADFDAIAGILQESWHSDSSIPNSAYGFLEASCDLAYCLSVSTFSQVALIDGKPRGIVLARSGAVDSTWAARWNAIERDLEGRMSELAPKAAQAYQAFTRTSNRVNERMIEESGLSADNEITLLAVDRSARNLGVGTILFDAATSYFSAQGQESAFLRTDTDCSWKFYERHGMKRMAKHRAGWEERNLLPREMYLYGLDLSA